MKIFPLLFSCALAGLAVTSAPGAEEPFPATAGPAIAAPRTPDGFTIVNGRVFFIRDGRMMPLDREVTLRVSPSGTITAFNGQEYAIPQGQVLTLVAGVAALPAGSEAVASTLGPGAAAGGGGSASSGGSSITVNGGTANGTAGNSTTSGDSTASGSGVSGVNMNGGGGSGALPFDLFGVASVIPGGQRMLGPNNGVTGTIANPAGGVTNSIGTTGTPNGTTINGATSANGSSAATATNTTGATGSNPANTSVNGTTGNAAQSPTAVGNQQNIGSQQISPGSNNIGNVQNPAVIGNQQTGQQPANQPNGTGANGNTTNPQNAGGQRTAPGNTTPTGNPGQVTPGAQTLPGAQQPLNPQPNGQTANPNGTTGNNPNGTTGNTTGTGSPVTTTGTTGGKTGGTTGGTAGGSVTGGAAGGGGGKGR